MIRLSKQDAAKLGINAEPKKRSKAIKKINPVIFKEMAKAYGLPEPEAEFKFSPPRKWRFDWYFEILSGYEFKGVGLEIQGGLFIQGRHTRGAALLKEYEKINEAQIFGYKVLMVTPQQVESGEAFKLVKRALFGD